MTISKQYASTHLAGFGGRSQNQSFPQTLEPLTLRSPPPQTIHVCTFPINVLTLKKKPTRLFFKPNGFSAPSLAQNSPFGGGDWTVPQGRSLPNHVHTLLVGRKGRNPLCQDTRGHPPGYELWAPRIWSVVSATTELRFYATSLFTIKIQLRQYLYTELNVILVLQKS